MYNAKKDLLSEKSLIGGFLLSKLNFINFKNKILKQLIIFILIISTIIPTLFLGNSVNAKQITTVVNSKPFNLYVTGKTNYKYCFEVLNLVNKERIKRKLKPLKMAQTLLNLANQRAAETSIYYSHTPPCSKKYSIDKYLDHHEMPYNKYIYVGENIAFGKVGQQNTNPKSVMKDWMNSKGHKANILSKNYSYIGVGCFRTSTGQLYWTQSFCNYNKKIAKKQTSTINKTYKIKCISKYAKVKKQHNTYKIQKGQNKSLSLYVENSASELKKYYVKTYINPSSFSFKSSNTRIATVNKYGKVKGNNTGNCNVTAIIKNTNYNYFFNININK